MKVKMKLDAKTAKELLLQHAEKIGFGIVVLIVLFMVYSALTGAETYQKTPEQLSQAADQAERTIEQTPVELDLKVHDYVARARGSRIPIEAADYKHEIVWTPPLFQPKPLREAPPLWSAQQLRGAADFGAIQEVVVDQDAAANPGGRMTGMRSGSEVRGERWIAVTALVPIVKQAQAYVESYANCRYPNPQYDVPSYLGYWVQRVEVSGPTAIEDIDWSKAVKFQSKKAMAKAVGKWSQASSAEFIETKYLHNRLVFPLPPLVGKTWGDYIAHEPEVPMVDPSAVGRGMMGTEGMGMPPGMGMGGEMMPGMGMGGEMMPGMGMPRPGRRGGTRNPGASGEADPFNPHAPRNSGAAPEDADKFAEKNKPATHLLLRFLDFTVEPGKRYVYRVQLALQNPNYGLVAKCLADSKLADDYLLKTKWSDPTPVISVPRDTRVLMAAVAPERGNRDATGRLMIAKWVRRRGFTAHKEFNVKRGQVLDFPDETFQRGDADPRAANRRGAQPIMPGMEVMPPGMGGMPPGMEGMMGPEMFPPGAGGMATPQTQSDKWLVNYYTEAIAIDFRGGEDLTGKRGSKLGAIGEILLLDADGNLVVHNELEDLPERDKITAAAEAAANPTRPTPGNSRPHNGLEGIF